MEQTTNNS